jgi:outer membrane protein assembly factor BamB
LLYAQDTQGFDYPPFWRQALGGAAQGTPAAQAESVVMIVEGGNLKAYSWQGRPLWDYFARGRLMPFVSRSREGASYICRTNGVLVALNRAGRELWQIRLGEQLSFQPLIGWDGRLFIFTAKKIRCFTASGFPLWSMDLEKKISLAPVLDAQGGFFLAFEDGQFLKVDAFGSSFSADLPEAPVAALELKLKKEDSHSILFFYPKGNMELFNPANETREPLKGAPHPVIPLKAASRGANAVFLTRDGKLAFLSMDERKILWNGNTHLDTAAVNASGFEATMLWDERGIYLMSKEGAAAFAENGDRLWIIRIRGAAALPSFSDEGVLYSGGADWILYAYRLEERVKAQKRVLYGPAPEGDYGTGLQRPGLYAGDYFRFNEEWIAKSFDEIGAAIRKGEIGAKEKDYASRLMDIAGSGLNAPRLGIGPAQPDVFVRRRVEALRLLSFFGSRETVPFLADLFARENDAVVKAAAAEALGRIGVDPEGLALTAFSNAIFPPSPLRDEHALTKVAQASGALCRFSGPPLSAAGIHILTALSGIESPPAVRAQAERELKTLRR